MNVIADPAIVSDGEGPLTDWRGVGYLVGIATERLTAPVEGIHRALLERWFGLAGPRLEPARRAVDVLAASIYKTIRLSGNAAGVAVATGAAYADRSGTLRPVWETRRGRYVRSIFNGVWGDRFADDVSPIRIELGLRNAEGRQISMTPAELDKAFRAPTGRIAVLLHGFAETERSWRSGEKWEMAEALEGDGFSVLRVRYNTGRAVTDNGRDLDELLEQLQLAWPVPITDIALIGHSMGGLVARSAVVAGRSLRRTWVELAKHLVAIAAPHFGSPIEKGVQILSNGLGFFKESRPLSVFLNQRSVGIKNLRYGVYQGDVGVGVKYHVVAGAFTADPTHPLGLLMGDLVVRVGSATGVGRAGHLGAADVLVVGGRNHARLSSDPEVISQVRAWLTPTQ
ncbi:MAG: GPI inositol-deacylase [Acidimicrobiia bacterium]|nr:GPI inositol-deacylase [Acidimicrobiia bacterium]